MSKVYITITGAGGLINTFPIQRTTQAIISRDYTPLDLDLTTYAKLPTTTPLFFSNKTLTFLKSANNEKFGAGYMFREATIGVGLPVLSTLKKLRETGDEIKRIEDVFSGTGFAACVKEVKDSEYTELDPRNGLNGLDVARKSTILARLSGLLVGSATSFHIQSLVPKSLKGVETAEEFLSGLEEFDVDMRKIKEDAEKEGGVTRFVGALDVETKEVSVGLKTFDKGSAVAGLKGSDNIISFYKKSYGDRASIVRGAGARAKVTAMGVLGDLVKVSQRLR